MIILGYKIVFTTNIEGTTIGNKEVYLFSNWQGVGIKYNTFNNIKSIRLSFNTWKIYKY